MHAFGDRTIRRTGRLVALAVAAIVATAQADSVETGDGQSIAAVHVLEGDWKLDRMEGFEEFLKATGTPWWKRKLARLGASRLHQTIRIEGNRVSVTNDSPVETRTFDFVADGATETETEGATGDRMTWIVRFEGDALVHDGHGDLGHRILRREIEDGGMTMTIADPDVGARCRLYFAPIDADR